MGLFMTLLLLILSVAPVIFFGYIIYKNDFDKEPKRLLFKLFVCGIASAFLTLLISVIMQIFIPFFGYETEQLNVIELIPYVFIGIALVEEFSKWIFVYLLEYNDQEFNHLYDGIVYAAFVSLGFACFENILYVVPNGAAGISTAITRALLAIPGHLCDGIMMGYFLSLAKLALKNNNPTLSKKNLILSLLVPTLAHGVYDYLIFAAISADNGLFMLVFFAFVVFFFIYSAKTVSKLSKNKYNLNPGYVSITHRNNNYKQPINNYNQNIYPGQNYNQGYQNQMYNGYPQQYPNQVNNYNQFNNLQMNNVNNQPKEIIYNGYCTNCGAKIVSKYCSNCGKQVK